jgi:urea transporter/murein DD-endopeptidase MepM/ murein hydrolase activator NlpD
VARVAQGERLSFALTAFLASYGQIFFRGSRWVGGPLLLATLLEPRVGLLGAATVAAALAVASLARLSPDLVKDGLYGYGALLVGLGVGASYQLDGTAIALAMAGAVVMVPVTAAAQSALWGGFGLPPLTLPFLLVFYLVAGTGQVLGLESGGLLAGHGGGQAGFLSGYLESMGAIFFMPRVEVGAVMLLALLVYSRIAVVLSVFGFALAWLLWPQLSGGATLTPVIVGYNFLLTAIALGGVWFVPSLSAFGLAAVGALVCGLITLGSLPYLARGGLPLLVLPFNVTVLLLLYAMRQRIRDGRPKAVDFMIGSPEENLDYFRTRRARFGAHYAVRLAAPFLGRWVCTQGVDGAFTHQGPWRHAFDFEVRGRDDETSRGRGLSLPDYHCYGLPVLAPAAATVVEVVDGVPDSPIGKPNVEENWGNLVVLQHGIGLFSLLCHLQPGSIQVKQGQVVRRGEELARCGSSGRAAVPHLHFQLQATGRVGAPTIEAELHDVAVAPEGAAERMVSTAVIQQGEAVRNLEPDPRVVRLFELRFGQPIAFRVDGHTEALVPDIDLLGNLLLRSPRTGARLFYEQTGGLFTIYDVIGSSQSVLHMIHAALARVPLEAGDELEWEDELFRPVPRALVVRALLDFIAPFAPWGGTRMRYRRRHEGRALIVEGTSTALSPDGSPRLLTRARLEAGLGLVEVSVTHRGRTRSAARANDHSKEDTP